MIAPLSSSSVPRTIALVRYGQIPEVARSRFPEDLEVRRGQKVVVQTHRGLELATVVDIVRRRAEDGDDAVPMEIVRSVSAEDEAKARAQRNALQGEFAAWERRIAEWKVDLQLIDLEVTLDGAKLILYVLNDRGPECTKLALQAAAAGFGVIEVQPVSAQGLVAMPKGGGGGGCGSGGCGCG